MKIKILTLVGILTLTFCTVQETKADTIEYYGSKAGLFRPCRGTLLRICKRIIITEKNDKPIEALSLNEDATEMPQTVIVEYDGVQYVVPAEAVNWEDGSIDESKL